MTPTQIELARHALGLPNKRRTSYRNHYCIDPGTIDHANWLAMVAAGEATHEAGRLALGGLDVFWLTAAGAMCALQSGEKLDLEDFPCFAPRKETNMSKAKTHLDEMNEARRLDIEKGATSDGSSGAMYRLMQRLDPHDVSHWIGAEVERSGKSEKTQRDIHFAFACFLAQLITPFCLRYGHRTEEAVHRLLSDTYDSIQAIQSKDGQFEVVSVGEDGRQELFTAYGIATQPPKGRCDPG